MPKWTQINNILLLTTASNVEEQRHLIECLNVLKYENKQLTTVCYVPQKHTKAEKWQSLPTVQYLYTDQTDLFQKPYFLPMGKFDLLINLTDIQTLPLSYISLYADALCRAGAETEKPYLYDLMIKGCNDKHLLFHNIIHYIKTFNQ